MTFIKAAELFDIADQFTNRQTSCKSDLSQHLVFVAETASDISQKASKTYQDVKEKAAETWENVKNATKTN
jgi:hypothetical protein